MDINAELIKAHRTERNWTQQILAESCGVSLRTIQRVERYGNASNETVMALASVLQIEQSDIIAPDIPVIEIETIESRSNYKLVYFIATLLTGMVMGALLVILIK